MTEPKPLTREELEALWQDCLPGLGNRSIAELKEVVHHLIADLERARALVAEKDKALREWIESNHTSEVARIALALTEEEMLSGR